ncbi:hypothetical protein PFISCL1PPCAC_14879 [Pristionchus fissidentatus]|uniref:Fe2OG dioxygenase domain-containing protein n=1 Tax=Pristionchus fissidentatus TaxID=1538716 RepID=A0AAV5VY02_9BILA|nr:hypothetical protein PFISCL1PPCAC_14879 [Pristionchus fissidentatus]
MWCRSITSPSRSTKANSIRERLICSVDTNRDMKRESHSTAIKPINREDRSRSPINNQPLPSSSTSNHYSNPDDVRDTVFRRAFKYYKKRDPRPDLSKVVNPRSMVGRSIDCSTTVTPESLSSLGLRPLSEWKIITFPDRVGLYLLPDLLSQSGHIDWVRRGIQYAMDGKNKTNIALHSDKPFSLLDDYRSLRWTTLGIQYDWDTKEYPSTGSPLPRELTNFASVIVSSLGLGIKADTTIVNYYPQKSTLSAHVDRSERTHSIPLVSLSVGRPAIYLTGGTRLNDPVLPILLQSGDVLVMDGDQRLVYHAVPAILPVGELNGPIDNEKNEKEDDEWEKRLIKYCRECRINFTIRQVNP